ncbi:MAG: hypothetical protein WC738_00335 [Candidatus Omnitrophota bacterium]|jgi:hypothetical protein
MILRDLLSKNRILIIAVALSLGLHLFWIASIKIVMKSGYSGGPVKFSKVSFLGPVYMAGSVELKAPPKEISFLEKRCRVRIASMPVPAVASEFSAPRGIASPADDKMALIIGEVLEESKSEPSPLTI